MTVTRITPVIAEAIGEIRETFDPAAVTVDHDGAGGAWVMIDPVRLGHTYVQDSTWIAFQITFPYPEADVYPQLRAP